MITITDSNSFQYISFIMFQLKLALASASHHIEKKVKCNANQYNIDLPLQTYRFVDILSDISFRSEFEPLLALLSRKKQAVQTFAEFYKLQEDAAKYFNRTLNLDFDDLSFKFLSESDKIFTEIDKCKFNDLLAIIRKAYDSFSEKLHSKFNRRIKKYLTVSTRNNTEKENIKKLVELIKADSTEEEPEPQAMQKVELKKQASNKKSKGLTKDVEKVEKTEKVEKVEKGEKTSKKSEIKVSIKEEKVQVEDDDNEDDDKQEILKEKQPKTSKTSEPTKNKHQNKHRQHKHKNEEDQADWQDVKEEKYNKRKDKNNKRKHDKFDIETSKHEENNSEHSENQYAEERPKERKQKLERRSENNNVDQAKKLLFDKMKEKPRKDLRVLLGLNGDTEDGWRERYRIERVPAILAGIAEKVPEKKTKWRPKEEKSEERPIARKQRPEKKEEVVQKRETTEKSKSKEQPQRESPLPEAPKAVKISSQQGSLQKIFSFPADGKSFQLDPSLQYRIRVNNNFWIILEKNLLKIQKDRTGYIRSGLFKSSKEYLLEAEDVTIAFDGLCNLQDGGTPFGDPVIQNFTGSQTQWFHLKELDVYTYI